MPMTFVTVPPIAERKALHLTANAFDDCLPAQFAHAG